ARSHLPSAGAAGTVVCRTCGARGASQPCPSEVAAVMPSIILHCPSCGDPLLADDEFCETCGTSLAAERDTPRNHWEVDEGWAAGVSDRGLVHWRNEDALHIATVAGRAVVVVCDGVS